eukprot:1154144-Pelagomonas_calceolata.AAC.3
MKQACRAKQMLELSAQIYQILRWARTAEDRIGWQGQLNLAAQPIKRIKPCIKEGFPNKLAR